MAPDEIKRTIDQLCAQAQEDGDEDAKHSWYCIAACAFAAVNQGHFVADVYCKAISLHHETDHEQQRHILRRIKESLLKTGIIYGIPRLINAFRALIAVLPSPEANEIGSSRIDIERPGVLDERGLHYMRNIFRADLDPFIETMNDFWPDLRTLVVTFIYGYYQSDLSVIDAATTSQINIATLVPMDVPSEVGWHMRGLIRNGGSERQLKFAYDTALAVCRIVRLKNRMPDPAVVIHEERLF